MKNYFHFIQTIHERLGIYDNPNAFYAPETETEEERIRRHVRHDRTPRNPAMQKAAAEVLKRMRLRRREEQNKRPPYPWNSKANIAGWWHPKHPIYTFSHAEGYHVTQLVRNHNRFGITAKEIDEGCRREANDLNDDGYYAYNRDGEAEPFTGEKVKAGIKSEDRDLAYQVQRVAWMKGWLKVYSGGSGSGVPSFEGISRDSIKAAIREFLTLRPDFMESGNRMEIVEVQLVRGRNITRYLYGHEIDKYLNS
jgi:hypothetical protein